MTEAFITLATTDDYGCGALVLAESLRKVSTSKQLVCMVTNTVSEAMRSSLARVFNSIEMVDILDSEDGENLALLSRPDLGVTFTKLHCWRLTQFSKAVFLDADTLVLQNIDELFDRDELSAAPDPGWPDCFNSGVFVYVPSIDTYRSLLQFSLEHGSFDGGDQGLLNSFFSDWGTTDIRKHLSFVYNCISQSFYSYPPAFKQFKEKIKLVHFIGEVKPWNMKLSTELGSVIPEDDISQYSLGFLTFWWQIFMSDVKPILNPLQSGLVGHLSSLEIKKGPLVLPPNLDFIDRKTQWERGVIDYTGADRFAHIQAALDKKINP